VKKVFSYLILLIVAGCNANERKEAGYIIFVDPSYWYFIPAKSIDNKSCVDDFNTKNLGKATQFRPVFNNSLYIRDVLDTIRMNSEIQGHFPYDPNALKIAPVEMEYTIDNDLIDKSSTYRYKIMMKGSTVEFDYNFLPIKIKKVTPLFCYSRKKSDVKVCDCKSGANDADDYLYKICSYLKSKGDISFQPCRYKVSKITESAYNGKKAIEVYLNCCYMGDRAYFDPQTKELISFAYSPE
jgi:hypothetical protein